MSHNNFVNSAVIRIPVGAETSLDSMINSSEGQVGLLGFLKAIKSFSENLRGDSGREYFEIDDFANTYEKGRTSIYRYLRSLSKQPKFVKVTAANNWFEVSDQRLKCYEFLNYSDSTEVTAVSDNPICGREAQNFLNDTLEYNGVDHTKNAPKHPNPITLESIYGTDFELKASNCTLSPANIITERREGSFYQDGERQWARATSYYGVFNEEDEDVLRRIQDITIDYLDFKRQKGEIDEYTDLSKVLIPIWVEDIADRQGLSRGPSVLKAINHSIIRAYHTTKSYSHIERSYDDSKIYAESQLRLIDKFHIIHANKPKPKKPLDGACKLEDRIDHDYSKVFKLCVLTWHASFYHRLHSISAYGIAHQDLAKLPLMIRRFYEKVRQDYFSNKHQLINDDGFGEGNLFDTVKCYWTQLSDDQEAFKLSHEMVKALRQIIAPKGSCKTLYNNILLSNEVVDENPNHRVIELDVFGVTMRFEIHNMNGYRDTQRSRDFVSFQIFGKELVEEAGAKYRDGRNNKPMTKNAFYQSPSTSRHMPNTLKDIEHAAENIIMNKYFMIYEVSGKSWMISPYMSNMEIQIICKKISIATEISELDVGAYITLRLEKLLVLLHLKSEQIEVLSQEFKVEHRYVVEFIIRRIAFITEDFNKTREMFKSKFRDWYKQRSLIRLH